jgi:hypothetical protein
MGQRSDYNTLVSMAIGHRLTKEQAKLVDHYRTHEGVPWKEAVKRLQRCEIAEAQDVGDSEDHVEPSEPSDYDDIEPTLNAVIHQLTVGEASDGDARDIAWCAEQLRGLLPHVAEVDERARQIVARHLRYLARNIRINAGRSFNNQSSVTDAVASFIEQHATSMEIGAFSFPAESGL